jgi:hypothetical protein
MVLAVTCEGAVPHSFRLSASFQHMSSVASLGLLDLGVPGRSPSRSARQGFNFEVTGKARDVGPFDVRAVHAERAATAMQTRHFSPVDPRGYLAVLTAPELVLADATLPRPGRYSMHTSSCGEPARADDETWALERRKASKALLAWPLPREGLDGSPRSPTPSGYEPASHGRERQESGPTRPGVIPAALISDRCPLPIRQHHIRHFASIYA